MAPRSLFMLCLLGAAGGLFALPASAVEPGELQLKDLAAEVRPFVELGTRAIALADGDLNDDGRKDYVLVLERLKAS